jgi:hypothetical protein
MTEGERKRKRPRARWRFQNMKVRVTGARTPNFYQDLPRPRLRHWHFTELGRLLPLDKLERSHDFPVNL